MFRREAEKAAHKCMAERFKPILEQAGAVQCVGNGLEVEVGWLSIVVVNRFQMNFLKQQRMIM